MPLGTEIGLGSGDITLDGRPSPHPEKNGAQQPPPQFSAHVSCGKRLDWSRCHLVRR